MYNSYCQYGTNLLLLSQIQYLYFMFNKNFMLLFVNIIAEWRKWNWGGWRQSSNLENIRHHRTLNCCSLTLEIDFDCTVPYLIGWSDSSNFMYLVQFLQCSLTLIFMYRNLIIFGIKKWINFVLEQKIFWNFGIKKLLTFYFNLWHVINTLDNWNKFK